MYCTVFVAVLSKKAPVKRLNKNLTKHIKYNFDALTKQPSAHSKLLLIG